MYVPAAQLVTAAAKPVSAVTVHVFVTYCVLFGAVHVVHELAVLLLDVNVDPAVHNVQLPLVPRLPELPGTYGVLMKYPAEQLVTAVATTVSVVVVQMLVTNCVLLGDVQLVHELAVLVLEVNVNPAVQGVQLPSLPKVKALPAR